jgi:hypothetical protein
VLEHKILISTCAYSRLCESKSVSKTAGLQLAVAARTVSKQVSAHCPYSGNALDVGTGRVSKAILVVSGHWEEADIAVMSNPAPPVVYEFSGFARELCQICYLIPVRPSSRIASSL